jgi:hypothetical protein
MTTLLNREQVDTLRSVGDSALVLMALWMIDCNYPGRASKAQEIAMCIRKDVRTVEKQLNELCATNRAANTSAGYILLEGGRALVLIMQPKALALSPDETQAQLEDQAQPPMSAITPTFPKIEKHDLGENVNAHNARVLVGGGRDSDSLQVKESLPPTSESDAQNVETVQALTTIQILEASEILFGEGHEVVQYHLSMELLDRDIKYVLACLAHTYANRQTPENPRGLHTPAGVAYRMLQAFPDDKPRPRREYLQDPWFYLPSEFAEVFGLVKYACDICNQTFERKVLLDAHMKEEHPVVIHCQECGKAFLSTGLLDDHVEKEHPEPDQPEPLLQETDDERALDAWQTVLGSLETEMPPASFQTWVKDSVAVKFDEKIFTVGVRNSYARDWLDSRMTSTIKGMLENILKLDVQVEFVVVNE